jgi:serine/threonine protein kinase
MAVDLALDGFTDAVEAGWGGFGVVYRAYQPSCARDVAIKVLNVRPQADLAQEFQRECAAIGSLSGHPNIVAVHTVGETPDGRPYVVMEYLHGGSLGDRVRAHGPLSWKEAAAIGVALAGALETAHRSGLLHRDVKPENVLVSRFGQPKLGDFGIARLHGASTGGSGGVVGSPRHLAPEVIAGHPPTIASDVYSLGSTLCTAVAGRPPTDGSDLSSANVPDPLRPILEQALAADPAARQASAEDVGLQLQAALKADGSAVPDLPIDPPAGSGSAPRRVPVRAVVAVACLVLLAVVAALASRNRRSDATDEVATGAATSTVPAPTVPAPPPTTGVATTTTLPPPQPGSFVDDFSGTRWIRSTNPDTFISELVDGQYRLALFNPYSPVWPTSFPPMPAPIGATPSHMVRVEADVTKVSSTRAFFGVACGGTASQLPYAGAVDTDGSWRIIRYREGDAPFDVRTGRDPAALSGPGPHRIVVECVGEGTRISITLWVNGVELGRADGGRGTGFGPGPGLLIDPRVGSLDVLFDNFAVNYA